MLLIAIFILIFSQESDAQCSGSTLNLTALGNTTGYVTSENYPASYSASSDCSWYVTTGNPDQTLVISMQVINIESGSNCRYDALNIYNGSSNEGELMGTICNTNSMLGEVLISNIGEFFFTFTSDSSVQYSGFKIIYFPDDAAYKPGCDSTLTATTTPQTVQSENIGALYTSDYACSYSISTSVAGAYIRISILFMDIENDNSCSKDKLSIYEGTSNTDTVLKDLCHRSEDGHTESYDSTGSNVFVEFTTDSANEFYGYIFTYKAQVDAQSSSTCLSTGVSLSINVGETASIETPNYPTSYENNMNCKWTVTGPTGYGFRVTFERTFEIEYNTYCGYDHVKIYDGDSTSADLINSYCGSTAPSVSILTTTNNMLVVFKSDYSITKMGFKLRYEVYDTTYPNCLELYDQYPANDTVLTISSTNYPSSYTSNEDVYYLIRNTNTTFYGTMVINFLYMYIESATGCIYDRITVYNGGCASFTVNDTLCGTRERSFQFTTADILLHFHSDGSVNRRGYNFEYYLVANPTTVAAQTTTTTAGPPVEAVIALMNEALENYSADALPLRDLTQNIDSTVNFYLVGINDLDEVAQKLTTTGQFEVQWRDAFLSWIPAKKFNIVQMLIPQDDLWKPDIVMMNGFTTVTQMGASFMFIKVDYNGTCLWRPYQIMESTCQIDMTYYPYDVQECQLKFGTWTSTDNDVKTNLGPNGLQLHENFQQNAEWTLLETSTTNGTELGNGVIIFTLQLKRNPSFAVLYMALPVIMLAFLNAFTFVLPLESGEKSGFSITVFLSFVVFLIIISQKMPANSDTISYFAAYVLAMTFLSAIVLMISIVQLRLMTFSTEKYSIRSSVQKVVRLVEAIEKVLLCQKKKDDEVVDLVAMEAVRQRLNVLYRSDRHKPIETENTEAADLIVSTPAPANDREEDEIKSVKSDVSSIGSVPQRPRLHSYMSCQSNARLMEDDPQEVEPEGSSIEWTAVVSAIDFIFFWIMLILTLILTLVYMLRILS